VISSMPPRTVAMRISVVARQESHEQFVEVALGSRTGFEEGEPRGRVRQEDVNEAFGLASSAREGPDGFGDIGDQSAAGVDRYEVGAHRYLVAGPPPESVGGGSGGALGGSGTGFGVTHGDGGDAAEVGVFGSPEEGAGDGVPGAGEAAHPVRPTPPAAAGMGGAGVFVDIARSPATIPITPPAITMNRPMSRAIFKAPESTAWFTAARACSRPIPSVLAISLAAPSITWSLAVMAV
jgi:hypothetical protein